MRVERGQPEAKGLYVLFNGAWLKRDVIWADDEAGQLIRYKRDADGKLVVSEARDAIETELLNGQVELTRVRPDGEFDE